MKEYLIFMMWLTAVVVSVIVAVSAGAIWDFGIAHGNSHWYHYLGMFAQFMLGLGMVVALGFAACGRK